GLAAFRLGPDKDDPLFTGLDMNFVDLEAADYMICTGLRDDLTETPDDYRGLLGEAAARALPMVCANPDIIVKFGDRTLWCAGALAQIYRELGGEVILTGKPHRPIYRLAFDAIERRAGSKVEKRRMLAIGDGLGTDIAGANAQGIDAVFIGAGIHGEGAHDDTGALNQEKLASLFEREGRRAVGAMSRLTW
ncbi:MAG: HAD hydrolase-like protein, partial [Pseudomonadota bacterium]